MKFNTSGPLRHVGINFQTSRQQKLANGYKCLVYIHTFEEISPYFLCTVHVIMTVQRQRNIFKQSKAKTNILVVILVELKGSGKLLMVTVLKKKKTFIQLIIYHNYFKCF